MSSEKKSVGARLKNAGYELFLFLTSWYFLRNFLGVLVMFTVLLFATFWWMDCYTRHGKAYPVQDFAGLTLPEAEKLANKKNFAIVVNDSLFLPGEPPNTVLSQTPKANSKVKKNRKIYLTVTKASPDQVEIPGLTGGNDDFATYKKKLSRLKVNTKVRERRFNNTLEPNTILEVYYNDERVDDKLREGFSVDMGSTVELIITERKGGRVPIPELVCMQYNEAEFLVGNFELNIGSVISDATVTDESSAYVWRQVPAFTNGTRLSIGSSVDIYLTQFKPDECR